jgi:vacuolar-type H+-ATPase subunit F/Vma7
MSAPVFLGDELDGIGFRLAGLRSLEVSEERLEEVFSRACVDAPLVILAASTARKLNPETLERAILDARPPIAIVREIAGQEEPPDMNAEVRVALGVAS